MTTYVFPGQGSQTKGMGVKLFQQFPEFIARADAILNYSITELCKNDPEQKLSNTKYTQPALYVVNALTFYAKHQQSQQKPSYLAGHSLGEYNALLASNVFDFVTGLQLVQKRAELMAEATEGSMAAVVGLTILDIKTIIEVNNLKQVVIANENSHKQSVLSGSKSDIALFAKMAKKAVIIPLKVSGAFHSPSMQKAQNAFETFLQNVEFKKPEIPIISNYTARPYLDDQIKNNLVHQITNPVRWTETVDYLLAQGEVQFVELGPGSVLTNLVNRIKKRQ